MGMLLHRHLVGQKKKTPQVEEKKVETKETLEKELVTKRRKKEA